MSSQLFYLILYSRDTCRSTNQQNFAQLGCGKTGIGKGTANRLSCSFYQISGQLIKFGLCQVHIKMFRHTVNCCDERQVNVGGGSGRKLFLSLLSSLFQSLQSHLITGKVNTLCSLELSQHIICNLLVEVITTQSVVTGCGQNLDNTVTDLNDGNIEGTAAQVVYHDLLLMLVVQTIGQSCCCRLVDDTFYIQTGNLTGILCSLTLSIVEVGRNCDNSLCYFLAQISLCIAFQFLQDHSRNLLRRIFLVVDSYTVVRTHMSLDGRDSLVSVGYGLTFCRLTNQTLACLCESYNRRCGSCSLCVCDNGGLSTFHYCYAAVCCTKVNTNNLAHNDVLLTIFKKLS